MLPKYPKVHTRGFNGGGCNMGWENGSGVL